jgi:hypothetical protein
MTALDTESLQDDAAAIVMAQVLTELRELRDDLRQMRRLLGLPTNGATAKPASDLDAYIMQTVSDIYRRQQPKPVVTSTVAAHLGYSQGHTRRLLKDCAARGLIALVPGRGARISGKWTPLAR